MKKLQFILLDAGPIIKLFELGVWDDLVDKCELTISRTVMGEAKWASQEFEDICINLESYEQEGKIQVMDLNPSEVVSFFQKFDSQYKAKIDPGENEILAFLYNSNEPWLLCSADKAAFRVLGLLGRANQGISLEELLDKVGLSKKLERKYTKGFRDQWTKAGQIDSIQGRGFAK